MDYQAFQTRLADLAEDEYRDFAKKGTPTDWPFLGVRVPYLRQFAKEIIASHQAETFLSHAPQSFEEVMVRGIVIASLPYDNFKAHLPDFLPLVDNWAVCDTFCNSAKSVAQRRADFLTTIDSLLPGTEFETRIALVFLLCYYVTSDYLAVVFDRIAAAKNREEYYIKMAIAWLAAECFIKFPDETWGFLAAKVLPKWAQNKAISKIRDSYRVDRDLKDQLLSLKIQ